MRICLTIAGSDPTGGAGLQADLRVFQYFGLHGLSAVTAITCQNTTGVEEIFPVEAKALESQLRVLLEDIRPDSLKTGMLYSKENLEVIQWAVQRYSLSNLVIDPVTVSSTGVSLLEEGGLDFLRERLISLAKIVTPNIYEASLLTGIRIDKIEEMKQACKEIKKMGPEAVIITGGHLEERAVDLFYDGEFELFDSEKFPGEFHGTGCIFSAAITANLALGKNTLEAVRIAKEFLKKAIKNALYPGRGMGILNTK